MLFQLCAAQPQRDEYWLEFVRRFNPLLVRSITVAWRKSGQGPWPPAEIAADLLQDVYTAIVKNDFGLLRNLRGAAPARRYGARQMKSPYKPYSKNKAKPVWQPLSQARRIALPKAS
ncbi:MAG: hypothetical protein HYR56_04345 [Acidobacteria bacterium]|nr:hypothetical protein [Acidobacteriota bacterium]